MPLLSGWTVTPLLQQVMLPWVCGWRGKGKSSTICQGVLNLNSCYLCNLYVEGVCGVCVVDGWFTASPGLSQSDWTPAG